MLLYVILLFEILLGDSGIIVEIIFRSFLSPLFVVLNGLLHFSYLNFFYILEIIAFEDSNFFSPDTKPFYQDPIIICSCLICF